MHILTSYGKFDQFKSLLQVRNYYPFIKSSMWTILDPQNVPSLLTDDLVIFILWSVQKAYVKENDVQQHF